MTVLDLPIDIAVAEPATCRPQRRPHQARAIAALRAQIGGRGRAQLHWACGTGKTLVGRWLSDDLDAALTVVFVPSIALVAQTLAEWQTGSPVPFRAIVVCSDRTTGDAWAIDPGWWTQHGVTVTTDPQRVAGFIRGTADHRRVVFATYHSAPVVADACRRSRADFDLMVCDEAHRLAGASDERFQVVLHDREIPARRRVFATATPVVTRSRRSEFLSMSDVDLFGRVADRLDFAEAIAMGLLVDYQVHVLDVAGDAEQLGAGPSVSAVIAAARSKISRVITFHSRVASARKFADEIDGLRLPDGRTVRARAVAGADPIADRRAVLAQLATGGRKTLSLVSNARCLTEGIDVPAVDGVLFADPKTSDTDIVQAIGRALRPAPGKTHGVILLPVVVRAGASSEELFAGPFAAVWGVLRALRALDPRMAVAIDKLRQDDRDHSRSAGAPHELLQFDIGDVDLAALATRLLDDRGVDENFAGLVDLLREWQAETGSTAIAWSQTYQGVFLGRWAGNQRRAYVAGALAADRVEALEAVPGWAWTLDGAWWAADHTAVLDVAARNHGLDLNDPDIAEIRIDRPGRRSAMTVGRWCAAQRRAARDSELTEDQYDACERIHGWSWTGGVEERDARMVDALAEWVEKHGDANVPHDARWITAPLGAFITAVRRRAVTGRLSPALAADIEVVTPRRPSPGALDWQPAETRWGLHYLALMQFIQRTGGCDIPEHHLEDLNGYVVQLYAWATRQRHTFRHGQLDPKHAAILSRVPSWQWERERAARVVVGIGSRQHGTRLGYAAGCICDECTAANTAYEAERQRLRAAGEATTDLVDSTAARGHLRVLEAQIGKRSRPTMQQVTGLNKKTIDEIINGDRRRIHPEVDTALRALTAEVLLAHIAANPSTRDPMPAAPTLALVDELVAAGWPKAWISREIGGNQQALQIAGGSGAFVRRETADAVAGLHAAVAGRRPPQGRQRCVALPTLAELVADDGAA